MAELAQKTGDTQLILRLEERVLEQAKKENAEEIMCAALGNVAMTRLSMGDTGKALELLNEAVSVAKGPAERAKVEIDRALAYLRLKDLENAEDAALKARMCCSAIPDLEPEKQVIHVAIRTNMDAIRRLQAGKASWDELMPSFILGLDGGLVPGKGRELTEILNEEMKKAFASGNTASVEFISKMRLAYALGDRLDEEAASALCDLCGHAAAREDFTKAKKLLVQAQGLAQNLVTKTVVEMNLAAVLANMGEMEEAQAAAKKARNYLEEALRIGQADAENPNTRELMGMLESNERSIKVVKETGLPVQIAHVGHGGEFLPVVEMSLEQATELAKVNHRRMNMIDLYLLLSSQGNPALGKEVDYCREEASGMIAGLKEDCLKALKHFRRRPDDLKVMPGGEMVARFKDLNRWFTKGTVESMLKEARGHAETLRLLLQDVVKAYGGELPVHDRGEILREIDVMGISPEVKKELRQKAAKGFGLNAGTSQNDRKKQIVR